jgi:hypothetical protein
MLQHARIEHEFLGGWTPYFALYQQDQSVVEVSYPDAVSPIRELSLIGGLEWRHPTWLLGGEYEDRESTIQPFDAIRARAQWSDRFDKIHHFSVTATQTWLNFHEPERRTWMSQANGTWRTYFRTDGFFYFDSAFQYNDDNLQGSGYGFAVGGGVEYKWRSFIFRVRAAHRETYGVTTDFRSEELGFWIVREFGAPPPSTLEARDRFLHQ